MYVYTESWSIRVLSLLQQQVNFKLHVIMYIETSKLSNADMTRYLAQASPEICMALFPGFTPRFECCELKYVTYIRNLVQG